MKRLLELLKKFKKALYIIIGSLGSLLLAIVLLMTYATFSIQPGEKAIKHTGIAKNQSYGLNLGKSNAYLIKAHDGYLLVDTGDHSEEDTFDKMLEDMDVDISEIKYVFITHHHHDHVGLLNDLREENNVKFIVHEDAIQYLKTGEMNSDVLKYSTTRGYFYGNCEAYRRALRRV
jgi:beta-lactamase superfamily II metal-dependent hydrolase